MKSTTFKVVKKTTTIAEDGEKFSIILKPNNKLIACKIEIKITTENVFVAQNELGFSLDLGDTVDFIKTKANKQTKIADSEKESGDKK